MAQPLLIAHPENASIEELKQVSRLGSNETATRCSAIQMLLDGGSVLSQTRRCAKDASAYQVFLDEADKSIPFQRTNY
jgi:hypothetical protein